MYWFYYNVRVFVCFLMLSINNFFFTRNLVPVDKLQESFFCHHYFLIKLDPGIFTPRFIIPTHFLKFRVAIVFFFFLPRDWPRGVHYGNYYSESKHHYRNYVKPTSGYATRRFYPVKERGREKEEKKRNRKINAITRKHK